jgi:hypothetical protein
MIFHSVEAEEGSDANDFDRSRPLKHSRRIDIKLPNSELLFDGVTPIFEIWEGQVLRKLQVHFWLFPNEATKFALIVILVSDNA